MIEIDIEREREVLGAHSRMQKDSRNKERCTVHYVPSEQWKLSRILSAGLRGGPPARLNINVNAILFFLM